MDEQSPRRGFRPRQFERARCLPDSKREMNEFPGGSVHKGVGSLFLTLSRRVVNRNQPYECLMGIEKGSAKRERLERFESIKAMDLLKLAQRFCL